MDKAKTGGIALLAVAGIVALLAILAGAFLQAGGAQARQVRSVLDQRLAEGAAESGLAYAAARLWEDPRSAADRAQAPDTANRCDDWTCRAPAASRANPSYARGDGWQERGTPDGLYTPGQDWPIPRPEMDLGGDGRLDAWSGRVRGGDSPFASRFSLEIRPATGLVCINSGELGNPDGDHDLDGIPNRLDTASTPYATDSDLNGADDWRDPNFSGNAHLVNLLNNLGAVLGLPTHTEPFVPAPVGNTAPFAPMMGTIDISDIGRQIVARRPRGGYGSISDLAGFLPRAEYETIAPFLALDGRIAPVAVSDITPTGASALWNLPAPEARYEFQARLSFPDAPVEILAASLRHLTAGGLGFVRLGQGEADRIAAHLDAMRKTTPVRSRRDLLAALQSPSLYDPDPFIVAYNQLPPGLIPLQLLWSLPMDAVQVLPKQDLIMVQWDANWYGNDLFHRFPRTLDVPREPATGFDGPDSARPISFTREAITGITDGDPFLIKTGSGPQGTKPIRPIPCRPTTGFTFSPGRDNFAVACHGNASSAAADRTGRLSLAENTLLLTSQQDFTPLLATGSAGDPNPARWTYAGGDAFHDGARPATRAGVQALPRFPLVAPDGVTPNGTIASFLDPAQYRLPRAIGALALSARQWPELPDPAEGLPGALAWLRHPDATFALPFNEDGAPAPGNRYGPGGWLDNISDPVLRSPAPAENIVVGPFVERGISLSPDGPRIPPGTHTIPGNPPVQLSETFEIEWPDPPFANAPGFPSNYGANGVPTGFMNWIREGTIVAWFPTESLATGGGLVFRYATNAPPPVAPWPDLLRVEITAVPGFPEQTDPFRIVTQHGYHTVATPLAASPARELSGTGWRCLAVTLTRVTLPNGHPGLDAELYLDGVPTGSIPAPFAPAAPPAGPRLRFSGSGLRAVDDVVLYKRVLTPGEIHDLALLPKYARQGTYASPRITFDPARFPDGVLLTGADQDALIPPGSGGTFDFMVTGYDDAGIPVGTDAFTDDGSGPQRSPIRLGGKIRSFDVTVDIRTTPPLQIADSAGNPVPILRDTPVLEEISFRYGDGRPRWTDLSDR